MIFTIVTALALLLGYGLTVGCSLVATFGIGSVSRVFVASNHKLTSSYKWLYAVVWLVCAAIGSFGAVAAASLGMISPWIIGAPLAGVLIGMLWINSWESRQRGIAHQLLISVTTLMGVAMGAWLASHFISH